MNSVHTLNLLVKKKIFWHILGTMQVQNWTFYKNKITVPDSIKNTYVYIVNLFVYPEIYLFIQPIMTIGLYIDSNKLRLAPWNDKFHNRAIDAPHSNI